MEDIYHCCRSGAEKTNSPPFVWFFIKQPNMTMQVVLQEESGNQCNFMKQTNQKKGSVTIFSLAQEETYFRLQGDHRD